MTKFVTIFLLIITSLSTLGQSIDKQFSRNKMKKDLKVFKDIRLKVNSGLYKYRTKEQIDSTYNWAENEIKNLSTYRDFHGLICTLTDFEGSLHNNTYFSDKFSENLTIKSVGYSDYQENFNNRNSLLFDRLQYFEDFLNNKDTQLDFTLDLIKKK